MGKSYPVFEFNQKNPSILADPIFIEKKQNVTNFVNTKNHGFYTAMQEFINYVCLHFMNRLTFTKHKFDTLENQKLVDRWEKERIQAIKRGNASTSLQYVTKKLCQLNDVLSLIWKSKIILSANRNKHAIINQTFIPEDVNLAIEGYNRLIQHFSTYQHSGFSPDAKIQLKRVIDINKDSVQTPVKQSNPEKLTSQSLYSANKPSTIKKDSTQKPSVKMIRTLDHLSLIMLTIAETKSFSSENLIRWIHELIQIKPVLTSYEKTFKQGYHSQKHQQRISQLPPITVDYLNQIIHQLEQKRRLKTINPPRPKKHLLEQPLDQNPPQKLTQFFSKRVFSRANQKSIPQSTYQTLSFLQIIFGTVAVVVLLSLFLLFLR